MGKKGKKEVKTKPFVSMCTPTFNRRPFIETLIKCINLQDYPRDRMEWIIVDDGTDPIEDLVKDIDIVKYFKVDEKMHLGAKRNFMHEKSKGEIIVYIDDDDYYPPQRVSHAVTMLQTHKSALCAGSSEIYIYFKHIEKMYQFGPYGDKHATAGTFAFKRQLLENNRYEDHAALAEEKAFLKNYTIPFVQLDPTKVILVFSHEHNTFDKKKLLDGSQDPRFCKESDKTVDNFIKNNEEIKDFYLNKMHEKLLEYPQGLPSSKPDVLQQIKEIEQQRKEILEKKQKDKENTRNSNICLNVNGQQLALPPEKVVEVLTEYQNEINRLKSELEIKNRLLENFSILEPS